MTDSHRKSFGKQICSFFIVMILFACLATVSFAEEQITLSVDNLVTYPTAEGYIYFGQKINEGVTLTGGEVQYNGEVIPGHFEFADPEYRHSTSSTGYRSDLIFVPDNTDLYTSFVIPKSKNVTFPIEKTTPAFVDENDTAPVTTEIESGAKLSTIPLSGAKVYNPYYPEETKALAAEWSWSSKSTVVTESGYYEAKLTITGYVTLKKMIYVRVAGDTSETKLLVTIEEKPVVTSTLYIGDDWSRLTFEGGKAVDINGDPLDGSFAFVPGIGQNEKVQSTIADISFVFTATDERYDTATATVRIYPLVCPISFGPDHKGTSIDDPYIFEVAPHADMGDVSYELKYNHLNWPGTGVAGFYNENTTAVNGQVYEYRVVNYNSSNYTGNIAYVKLVFATTEITPSIVSAGSNKFKVDCAGHSVPGTFTIYHNDVEIATVSRAVSYVFDCEVYTDEGGTSHIKAVYNPVENDYYVCNDAEVTYVVPAMHSVTNARSADNSTYGISMKVLGSSSFTARAGQTVELRATLDSFVCWTFKDADGNEVTLEGVDLNAKQNTFIMPDYDLFVSYKIQEDIDREEAIANCDHLCHSDNEIIRLFWNIINMFFRLLNVQQYCDCGEMHYSAPLFPIA